MAASHPSPEQLLAFRAGRLPPAARQAVERHLLACAACRDHTPRANGPANGPRTRTAAADRFTPLAERAGPGPGRLFEAADTAAGRRAVLRLLPADFFTGPDDLARFLTEARAAARVRHPALAAMLAADAAGPEVRVVTEDAPATSLAQRVAASGPLPVPTACGLVHQAALAVQAALDQGVTHRCLSPDLLAGDDAASLKVLGLGQSRLFSTRLKGLQPGQAQLFTGAPGYADPILALESRGDPRGDAYGLGAVLWFLLTGQPPFVGASLAEQMLAQLQHDPPSLAAARPDAPAVLQAIVQRLLARDPARRFATPGEAARALAPLCPPIPRPRLRAPEVEPCTEVDEPVPDTAVSPAEHAESPDDPPALPPVFWTGIGLGSAGTVTLLGLLITLLILPALPPAVAPGPGPRLAQGPGPSTPPDTTPALSPPEPGTAPNKPAASSPEKPAVPPVANPQTPIVPPPPEPTPPEPSKPPVPSKPPEPGKPTLKRRPLPAKAALDAAAVSIRDVYLAGAARMNAEEQKARARDMLAQAKSSREEEPNRFVLYREAAALAAQAGDVALASEALEDQGQVFETNTLAARTLILEKAVAPVLGPGSPPGALTTGYLVADLAGDLLRDALRQDDFDVALRLTGVLQNAGRRAGLKALEDVAVRRATEVRETQREHERVKPALDLLRALPDDPEACLEAGRYRALWLGDWDAGLPLLARGQDPVLKDLAVRTLALAPASTPDPVAQATLADAWLDVADNLKGPARQAPAWRAYEGYRTALAHLDDGRRLSFAKPGGRLARIIPVVPSFPVSRWTFDLGTRDCIAGVRAQVPEGLRLVPGRLPLRQGETLATLGLPCDLRERTLEAWVYLPLLAARPRNMKVLRLEQGSTWDGIVFGESQYNRWGTSNEMRLGHRSRDIPQETAPATEAVHVAATYAADGTVNLYRNGVALAAPALSRFPQQGDRVYTRDKGALVFGPMVGVIEEARLYDRCLTPSEVATSYRQGVSGHRP